jgi:hypothetical protein
MQLFSRGHAHACRASGRLTSRARKRVKSGVWDEIDAARIQLKQHLDNLIAIVRERYIEIDTDNTNAVFAKGYASVEDDDE